MNRFYLIIILVFLKSNFSFSQNLYFQSYTTREGLTQNSVYSITQSKDGFMWFGTQHGLNRFDGKKIVPINFIKTNNSTAGEFSGMITALYIDKRDNFWIGTTAEIFLFDRFTNKIFNADEKYKGLKIGTTSWIEFIQEDNFGNLIIHTRDALYLYNFTEEKLIDVTTIELKNNVVSISVSDNDKKTYLATENEIYSYDGSAFTTLSVQKILTKKNTTIKKILVIEDELWIITTDNKVWISNIKNNALVGWRTFSEVFNGEKTLLDPSLLHKTDNNTVWMGSRSEGVLIANIKTKVVKKSSTIYHPNALKKKFVLSFYTGYNNITWIGVSGGGVSKYDQNVTQFGLWRNETVSGKAQPDNMILSMYSENDEDFYLGTLNGGLLHTNVKTNESNYYEPPLGKNNKTESKNIYSIIKGNKNELWMATWGGLCSFDTKTKQMKLYNDSDEKTIQLSALIKLEKENKILVGGNKMRLRLFDLNTHTWQPIKDPENVLTEREFRVRYMHALNEDEILLSSEVVNLCKYNIKTGKFTFYKQFQKVSGMSTHCYITDDFWWIGTNDGLIQADAKTQKIIQLWNKSNGLSDKVIYSVLPDNKGNIWVGTNQGLNAIDPKTGICKKYNESDGLQSMEFNTASCFKDKSGNLWFGGVDGFNKVPVNAEQQMSYNSGPMIINVQVMNETFVSDTIISYLKNITLNHKNNFINFEFQSPNFSQPENIVYKYRLIGLDTSWVYSGTRNFVNYTQLNPGEYTFEVKSANTNLDWSTTSAKINISILSPWYKTWWFYLLASLSILFLIQYWYKQRLLAIRTKADIKHKMSQTEMAALKAQMNPHFIFNCINSIDAFIQSNDKYNASLYLNKFAKLIRNILDSSKHNLVSLERDVETMKLYVELEEMRTDNKFKSEFIIDDDLYNYDINIPPLIIQPYLENAIIHGLRNKEENDGLLIITITKENDIIKYEIRDNGIGRKAASKISRKKELSYGMQLSEDRVKLFNEEDIEHVKITDLYEGEEAKGTQIEVKLKIS